MSSDNVISIRLAAKFDDRQLAREAVLVRETGRDLDTVMSACAADDRYVEDTRGQKNFGKPRWFRDRWDALAASFGVDFTFAYAKMQPLSPAQRAALAKWNTSALLNNELLALSAQLRRAAEGSSGEDALAALKSLYGVLARLPKDHDVYFGPNGPYGIGGRRG